MRSFIYSKILVCLMIEEKEVLLLSRLYHLSNNSMFKKNNGTKADIELKINNSIRNMNFDIFWKKLISIGIIKLSKKVPSSRGNPLKIYSIDKKKLFKYLKLFNMYQDVKKIVWSNDI